MGRKESAFVRSVVNRLCVYKYAESLVSNNAGDNGPFLRSLLLRVKMKVNMNRLTVVAFRGNETPVKKKNISVHSSAKENSQAFRGANGPLSSGQCSVIKTARF